MTTEEFLKPFCDPIRNLITTPFSQAGWTWATNGRLIIRIPHDPAIPERFDAPKVAPVWAAYKVDDQTVWEPLAPVPLPKIDPCPHCEGTGLHYCEPCDTGHDCAKCKATGEVARKVFRKVGDRILWLDTIRPLSSLEGIEIAPAIGVGPEPMPFRFKGGCGLACGMNPAEMGDGWVDEATPEASKL